MRLYPVELQYANRYTALGGLPRLAAPEVARAILQDLQRLSQPYDTTIEIAGSVGIIRPSK